MKALSVGLTNLSALQVIKKSKLDKRLAPLLAIGVIDSIIRPNSNTKLLSSGSSMSTAEECEDTLEMSSPDTTSKVGKKSKKKEKRSEACNCGVCNEICENEAILCDTCHNFYHSKCENITPSLKLQLSYLMQDFVCSNCCQKDNYDFEAAISRLSQSAVIGQLDSGVQMEKILLRDKPEFNVQHTLQKGKYVIDRIARSILKKYAKHITAFPVAIERDGNCLFSALSVAVHGNATKAAELRTRTAIEMVSHRKFYQSVHVRSGILLVSPDLEEACLDCAQNGCYSSAWTIHAASSVLGRPIRSIYPPVNGLHDRCYEIMDRTFAPRILIDSSDVTIMWSGENPSGRKAWIPNHFVPLLRLEKDDPIVENTDLQYTAVYTMVNNEVVVSTDNSGISLELDPAILYEELPVVGTPIDACPSDNPLRSPERFLTPNEIFKIMLSEKPTSTSIPNGIKHNVYFLLDNSVNISRWANGQRSQYKDDCNWSTKTSSNRHYYVLVDDHLSYVDKKDGLFCKDVNHKRIPIEPQPEEDSIILFRRYYATHKDLLSFKKKISVVLDCPSRLDHLKSLSVIEYVGPWPTNYPANYPTMTSSPKKRKIIKKPNETFDEQANAVQMIQANKIRPIKIEKFRNDSRFDETSYYFKDGLRYVKPYSFVFQCHIKGRWFGKKIIDVCKKEFRAEAPDFYEKSIAVGLLKINGKRVKHGRTLWNNELLTSRVHRHEPPVSGEPIRIIHSDDDVVVVDKPASIPVHPCGKYRHNTLVFILGKEYGFTGLHTIHRLDRLTSGLLIFARTAEVSKKLDAYVRDREVEKTYLCKVKGQFPSDPIICEEPIQIVSHKIGVCRVSPQGKTCKTTFQSLSYDGKTSIVQCVPHTGRMHQIRVHLQYLGFPITNDPLYNNPVWGTEIGKHDSATRITDEELIQRLLVQRDEELLERLVEDNRQSSLDPDGKDNIKSLRKRTDETERDESSETLPKKFKSHESFQDNKESDNMEIKKINEIKEINSDETDYLTNSNLSNIETTKIKVDNSEIIDFNKIQCYQEIKGIEGSERIKGSEGINCKAESSMDIPETSTSSFNLAQQIKCDEVIKEAECGDTTSGINMISTTSEEIISESKSTRDTASTVDGSDCVSDEADGCDAFLPPEVAMLRDGETEEDRLNRIVITLCRDCKVKYRDPIDSELRIYLHALRYKGPDFDYSTEVPSWAQEHLDRCQKK